MATTYGQISLVKITARAVRVEPSPQSPEQDLTFCPDPVKGQLGSRIGMSPDAL